MNPEDSQMDLFTPASDPALLQPATGCIEDDPVEMRNRSPTLNEEQGKLARSLHRKSRELVRISFEKKNLQIQ